MSVNKVVVDGETVFDLTNDTVTEGTLLENVTAHNAAGKAIKGSVVAAPIDTELSSESENPVANKAIAAKIAELEEKIGSSDGYSIITGTYTGDGSDSHGKSQVIDIGATPNLVFVQPVWQSTVSRYLHMAEKNMYFSYGSNNEFAVRVIDNGFEVKDYLTNSGTVYMYIAFVKKEDTA